MMPELRAHHGHTFATTCSRSALQNLPVEDGTAKPRCASAATAMNVARADDAGTPAVALVLARAERPTLQRPQRTFAKRPHTDA